MSKVKAFVKQNPVVTVAAVAALITMFLVPPDAQYLGYFDWRTLTVDGCHPNDIGFMRMADKIGSLIAKVIK